MTTPPIQATPTSLATRSPCPSYSTHYWRSLVRVFVCVYRPNAWCNNVENGLSNITTISAELWGGNAAGYNALLHPPTHTHTHSPPPHTHTRPHPPTHTHYNDYLQERLTSMLTNSHSSSARSYCSQLSSRQ